MPRGMGPVQPQGTYESPPPVKRVGVRLAHATLRNCTWVVPTRRKYKKGPYQCPTCNKEHEFKTYHLNLDDQGTCIVSEQIFKNLKRLSLPDLSIANEVNDPPSQTLFMGSTPKVFNIEVRKRGLKPDLIVATNKLFDPRRRVHG
jgi:hypothetical protein